MIYQIETLRAYIRQHQILGGVAYNGHKVHFWFDKHHTYCGKSNLARRDGRLWTWEIASLCKDCLSEIEQQFIKSLAAHDAGKDEPK